MKLLNLDELVSTEKTVTILGNEYPVQEQSLGNQLEALKALEDMPDDEASPEVRAKFVAERLLSSAKAVIPDCPDSVMNRLTMTQMQALIEFAAAPPDDVIAAAEESQAEDDDGQEAPGKES